MQEVLLFLLMKSILLCDTLINSIFFSKFVPILSNNFIFRIMEKNELNPGNEIQVELMEEVAQGTYANLVIIAHSSSEFILDFIRVVPGVPKAKVKSRIILTPDNAKRLLLALQDNIRKFEEQGGNAGKYNNIIPPLGGIKGEA
jgi:hypothetical protein